LEEEMEPKLLFTDLANISNITINNVHKRIKSNNLPYLRNVNRLYIQHEAGRAYFGKPTKREVISVQTAKGGVGKSSLCLNFAIRLWLFGHRVLVIDIDQQANISKPFGQTDPKYVLLDVLLGKVEFKDAIVKYKDGLDIIPSSLRNAKLTNQIIADGGSLSSYMPKYIDSIRDSYDTILIDCPPAIGHILSSVALASDLVISPVDPDNDAIDGASYIQQEVQKLNNENNKNIGFKLILNKYDARTVLSPRTAERLGKSNLYNEESMFESVIGVSQDFYRAKEDKCSIYDYMKPGRACTDIDNLVIEYLELGKWAKEDK